MGEFTDRDRDMLVETHTLVKSIVNKQDDHEERIRSNETFKNKALGLILVIPFAFEILKKKIGF